MNKSTHTRRALLAVLLTGSVVGGTVGCSGGGMSLASLNPLSKPAANAPETLDPAVTEALAENQPSTGNQLASFGAKTKEAVVKSTSSVTGMFSRNKNNSGNSSVAEDDPLRLDNSPSKVDPQVFVANGQLWESTGNFGKAMESYSKALDQQANHVPAMTNIARLHYRQGNHRQAASFFQKAIEQQPDDPELFHDLGLTLSKLGQNEPAIQTLSKALQMSPGNSRYANNLATVQFEAGNREVAFDVLQNNNKPAVAHFNMAYLHVKQGQTDAARKHLNETLEFEALAASDAAVKRAVDRSRQMLQQLDGNGPNPAQLSADESIAAQRQPSTPQQATPQQATPQRIAPPQTASPAAAESASPNPAVPVVTAPKTGTSHSLPSGFTMPGEE